MTQLDDSIRVLHVDDEPDLADVAAEFLEREEPRLDATTATSAQEAYETLQASRFECVVSDYDMPRENGIEFLQRVREDHPDLPFILYTGKGSEEVASDAISAGVTDYLQKERGIDQYAILANRITNAVEHARIEDEAEQTRRQLEAITNNAADGILTIDPESRIRFANAAVEDHLGYAPNELVGESLFELIPERYRDDHREGLQRYLETGDRSIDWSTIEFRAIHADGHEVPLSLSFSEYYENGEPRFIGNLRDISDRTEMEEALREREERFRQVTENLRDVIWMSDPEKTEMHYVNPAYEDVWGRPVESLYENPASFLETIHPEDRDRIEAALQKQESGEYDEEYRIVRPDGEMRWVRDRAVPVENDDGEVYRIVGIAWDITEQKRHVSQMETLISNLPGIVYRCRNDTDWPMELIRGECEALTGYTAEEITSGDVQWGEDIIHPKDQSYAWEVVQAAIQDDTDFQLVYRALTKDGETRWLWERGREVDSLGEDEIVLEGFITDITGRKQHEHELQTTNALLSTLIEELPVGIIAEDESRNVLAVNQRLIDIFDIEAEPESLVGTDCEAGVKHVADRVVESEQFVERINDLVAAREPSFNELVEMVDGRIFERSYQPLALPEGGGHLWMYHDVTQQTKREAKLEALHETFRSLMDADTRPAVAEIAVDAAENVLGLDTNAVHLYDQDENALVPVASTAGVDDLIGDLSSYRPGDSIAWRAYVEGEPLAVDDVHEDPDVYNPETAVQSELFLPIGDHGILVAGSATPAAFDHEDLVFGELLASNIATALEQVGQTATLRARERRLAQQNERLDEFASVVSHDLRNPLNVATGRLQLAQEECDSEHLDAIARAHDRMDILIKDLLELARNGRTVVEPSPVDLGAVARRCWHTVETGVAELSVEANPTLLADESRFRQLLENLFRNAVEHGGTDVTITLGRVSGGFYVADDGPGVPGDERSDVFDEGYSTSDRGTGFGLSIVQQIVDAHDWTITLTESEDGGARFEITDVEFDDD